MNLYILVILLVFSSSVPAQNVQGKILIDVEHSSLNVQNILNELVEDLEGEAYQVEFTRTIMYLDPYDVLVLTAPTKPFTREELNSISFFVENGGGLLLLGESGVLSSENLENFNVLAEMYGIRFQRDVIIDPVNNLTLDKAYPEIPLIENFTSHPVTHNVRKIFFVSGCSLRLSKKARKLAWGGEETYGDRLSEIYGYGGGSYEPDLEKKGEDLILMAYAEHGNGRVIALGDTSLFRGQTTAGTFWPQDPFEYLDHRRLARNIFAWLSLKSKLGSAMESVNEAQAFIEQGKYQEAKDILENVRSSAPRLEGYTLLRQITLLMIKADQGLEADIYLQEGKEYMANLNCEEASKNFEKAFTIYEALGSKEKLNECVALLTECGDRKALLNKADSLYAEAQTLFEQKKYSEALDSVEEAKIIYERLDSQEGVQKCDTLLSDIQDRQQGETETEESKRKNQVILAVILIITTVVIVIVYLWRRTKPSPQIQPYHARYRA